MTIFTTIRIIIIVADAVLMIHIGAAYLESREQGVKWGVGGQADEQHRHQLRRMHQKMSVRWGLFRRAGALKPLYLQLLPEDPLILKGGKVVETRTCRPRQRRMCSFCAFWMAAVTLRGLPYTMKALRTAKHVRVQDRDGHVSIRQAACRTSACICLTLTDSHATSYHPCPSLELTNRLTWSLLLIATSPNASRIRLGFTGMATRAQADPALSQDDRIR